MTAVMRHVRSEPIHAPAEPTAEPTAERSVVGHLITVAIGLENARRRDREAATRKAAKSPPRCSCNKEKAMNTNTTTHAAPPDAVPPPPDAATTARELRSAPDTWNVQARANAKAAERAAALAAGDTFAPPDTYGLVAAGKLEPVPPPPSFAAAAARERLTGGAA